jgi:hypothetical protein
MEEEERLFIFLFFYWIYNRDIWGFTRIDIRGTVQNAPSDRVKLRRFFACRHGLKERLFGFVDYLFLILHKTPL